MKSTGTTLVIAAAMLALGGCGSSASQTATSTAPAGISASQTYQTATALAEAMAASGVTCESEKDVVPPASGSTSQVHCDGTYGTLGLYTFTDAAGRDRWSNALKPMCSVAGGDEFITGPNWAILPTDMRGNSNTETLAAALGLKASSVC